MEIGIPDLEGFQYVLLGLAVAWAFIKGLTTLTG